MEIKCQLDATDDFYCRSYCLLNVFQAPLCPSSGAREYYTSGCCLSYLVLGFQVVGMVWSWVLCVRFAGCCFNPLNAELNPICHLLALLGDATIVVVSRLKVNQQPANQTHNPQLHTIPTTWKPSTKYDRQQPLV